MQVFTGVFMQKLVRFILLACAVATSVHCSDGASKGVADCLMRMSFLKGENTFSLADSSVGLPAAVAVRFKKKCLPATGIGASIGGADGLLIADSYRDLVDIAKESAQDCFDYGKGGSADDYYAFVHAVCYLSGAFDGACEGLDICLGDELEPASQVAILKNLVEKQAMPEAACFLCSCVELLASESDAKSEKLLGDFTRMFGSSFATWRSVCDSMDAVASSGAYASLWAEEKEWCRAFAAKYIETYKVLGEA